MGKSTRKKQDKHKLSEEKVMNRLALSGSSGKHKRGVISASDIESTGIDHLIPNYIRDIRDWVYPGKSKRSEKHQLDLLRHLCAVYPVPKFLEDMVLGLNEYSTTSDKKYCDWYVAVAQGKSLYKTCTREHLSKRETHLLLQAPSDLEFKQAIWWAKAMAISNDVGIAYRMATSVINVRGNYKADFWIDVHRFFTNNPVTHKEMEELFDYIMSERRESNNWDIKKRSLESIRRKSEIWHRAQFKMKRIGGGSWNGMEDVGNWKYVTGKPHANPAKNTETVWQIRQIVTGNDLVKEGQRMHHCVGSYKGACMSGKTAIFSMTSSTIANADTRNLTFEVEVQTRRIVQARGYANRSIRPQEREVLNRWANETRIKQYLSRY